MTRFRISDFGFRILCCVLAIALCCFAPTESTADEPKPVPTRLPPVKHPADNPPSSAKIALGKRLFFDTRLSRTNDVACATCHDPAKGWSNGQRFATGVDGRLGTRNSPTLINVAYNAASFWDGRAGSLEEQALMPIQHPNEMDLPLAALVKKLNADEQYRRQFREVFGTDASADAIAKAIAAFERTIVARDAPIDHFVAGDKTALSPAALRGMQLFFGDARCHVCHAGPNFTDNRFHNVGVGVDADPPDRGREQFTGEAKERGAFKTPTLREVARTAPYMHDGSFATLNDVVRHYNFGVTDAENEYRDQELQVLYLSEEQVADLVTFLKEGLSGDTEVVPQ
jgi:cytochrome c peroxidase